MYEDAWYSFVPELQRGRSSAQGSGHRRRESLLQQPSGSHAEVDTVAPLEDLLEEDSSDEEDVWAQGRAALLLRRCQSQPELGGGQETSRARPDGETSGARNVKEKGTAQETDRKRPRRKKTVTLAALALAERDGLDSLEWRKQHEVPGLLGHDDELLAASQQEFEIYRDQLDMTERHLARLVADTNGALQRLASLAGSFRTVEEQTTLFQAQCNGLLAEQRRLEALAAAVGHDLHYYAYLDNVTRRLNAPGASRLVDDDALAEILADLDACIAFMAQHHAAYRDAESYLARYQALLTKALHLLEVGFGARLDKVSAELARQIAATQSESARHALAYGRFQDLLVDGSYSLVPNVQTVVAKAYDRTGAPRPDQPSFAIYANTAAGLFRAYLAAREQTVRLLGQHELEAFRAETKSAAGGNNAAETKGATAVETAARHYIKQCFERSYSESRLFARVFALTPDHSTAAESVFAIVRAHRGELFNGVNIAPLAVHLQAALAATNDLAVVCHVLGWIAREYLRLEYDDDGDNDSVNGGRSGSSLKKRNGSRNGNHKINDNNDDDDDDDDGSNSDADEKDMAALAAHSRPLAARLLSEHLWAFADGLFEADIAKTIAKAPVVPEALKITPVVNGQAASNAYPPVRHALDLLVMFDQAMPKERCQRNSPVVFRIVRESILALQRAEARIKAGRLGTDADLFMIKNLLLLKNELLSLEIGDIRNGGAGAGALQHFGQIWDALSLAQNLVGYFSHFIPGTSLWRGGGVGGGAGGGGDSSNGHGGAAGAAGGPKGEAAERPSTPISLSGASIAASIRGGIAASLAGSFVGTLGMGDSSAAAAATAAAAAAAAADQDASEQLDDALRRSITAFTQRWGKALHGATSRQLGGKNVAKLERELEELLQTAFSHQPEVVAKLKEAIQIQASGHDDKSGSRISRV